MSGIYDDYLILTPHQLHQVLGVLDILLAPPDPLLTLCFALEAGLCRPVPSSGQGTPEILWKELGGFEEKKSVDSLSWLLPARCGLTVAGLLCLRRSSCPTASGFGDHTLSLS